MFEVNIDLKKLIAINLLAAEPKDGRPHLCGVYVEATPTKTRIAATNGAMAGLHANANPLETNTVSKETVTQFIIPSELIERLKPGKEVAPVCTVLIDATDYTLRLWDGTRMPFKPVDGVYPDLRRVVPTEPASGEACNFNVDMLATFMKVNKGMTGTKFPGSMELGFRGERNALTIKFPLESGFVGLLMPRASKAGDIELTTHHTVERWDA